MRSRAWEQCGMTNKRRCTMKPKPFHSPQPFPHFKHIAAKLPKSSEAYPPMLEIPTNPHHANGPRFLGRNRESKVLNTYIEMTYCQPKQPSPCTEQLQQKKSSIIDSSFGLGALWSLKGRHGRRGTDCCLVGLARTCFHGLVKGIFLHHRSQRT